MVLQAEQVAGGGAGVDADQDGSTVLDDLVVGTDPDRAEVLPRVEGPCRSDRLLDEVVNRPE
ncbi:hypothetical protein [Fimbriiglobus ruber]|uniref:hypothetical protein n=1 Tax=Fimbriiglobus ruber TaxID=1908690 RepID=UPI000B4A6A25|nr:hypothetical protein [Fimbriiglobus ruber]